MAKQNLYCFNCSPRKERLRKYHANWDDDPEFWDPDWRCQHCEDKIFFFTSTKKKFYQRACEIIASLLKSEGDYLMDNHPLPPSFLCLETTLMWCICGDQEGTYIKEELSLDETYEDPQEVPEKVVKKFLLKENDKEDVSIDLKACIRNLGAFTDEEIVALQQKIY